MKCELSNICYYVKEKIPTSCVFVNNYVSTENLQPNKVGIVKAASLPSSPQVQSYKAEDVLVSNIRPYFKKIWFARNDGGCSSDVLVFRAKKEVDPSFLYYVLADDSFFAYSTATSKGTKMPRGDKTVIMKYEVPSFNYTIQKKISKILKTLDDKIELNNAINQNLEQQAQALYKSWFVDFEPFGGVMPDDWREYHLSEFLPVITGKKNANIASTVGKYPFFSCSKNITWTSNYSFDANAILVAGNGEFNVKFYSGKFEAYQRTYVLIPYESKYTAWLYYVIKNSLNEITKAARGSVINFITKSNLENFTFYAPADLKTYRNIYTFDLINRKIEANNRENFRLENLRDTLLPKLMSGELDVTNIDI